MVERKLELTAPPDVATLWRRARQAWRAAQAPAWLLSALTAAVGLLLLSRLPHSAAHGPGLAVDWWLLAALYAVAEIAVVHLHFRRDAHTIALGEVPLVLGLFFATPAALVAGRLVGSAVALVAHRRQPPVKLAFNLALFLTETSVALTVFTFLRDGADPLSARAAAAVLCAAVAGSLLSSLWIAMAAAAVGQRQHLRGLPGVVAVAVPVTLLNTLLAVAGARLLARDVLAAMLTTLPLRALGVAYHRYTGERRRHQRLELLYNSSQALHRAHGVDDTIGTLLSTARDMFCAERAVLVLLPVDDNGESLHLSLPGPGDGEVRRTIRRPQPAVLETARRGQALLMPRNARTPLHPEGMHDAMVVALSGDNGVFSALLVGDRSSDVDTFDRTDLTLLETFAAHASISIERGRLAAEMERMAYCDPLTQLANRALLTMRLHAALSRAPRGEGSGRPAVLFVDLDDFKTVNDTMGHTVGDRLLVVVAERLRACLRGQDVAARIGGDEFAVLLENVDAQAAADIAERLVETMRTPYALEMEQVVLHASVGVVVAAENDRNADDLLARADIAMYKAKEQGKGRWEMFAAPLQEAVVERHRLKTDLRAALGAGELFLHYQPIVALQDQRLVGVEALVRWRHPRLGLVSPDEFIPLAEETGLIVPLGRTVLEGACAEAAGWGGDAAPFVTVNISARELHRPAFAVELAGLLGDTGLAPQRLVLEITERVMAEDDPVVRTCLDEVRRLGVRLAIDDFGTGYSSLSCLRELPVDIIKIAKSFVDDAADDRHAMAFAAAIVRLGETLGVGLIAEGIERHEQAGCLRELHCGMGQGYLFSRPVAHEQLAELMGAATPPAWDGAAASAATLRAS